MARLKTRNPEAKFRAVMECENPQVWSVVDRAIDKHVEEDPRQIPDQMKVSRV